MMFRWSRQQFRWFVFSSFFVICLIGMSWPYLPYRVETIKMCPISGSVSRETVWFGVRRELIIESTPLAAWVRAREPDFVPEYTRWCVFKSLLFSVRRSCFRSPPVALLEPIQEQLGSTIPDDTVAELLRVLRNEAPNTQMEVVDRLLKEYDS